MGFVFSIVFLCPSIGLVLFLLFAIFRYFQREKYKEKYVESISKLPEANREKFIESEKFIVKLFRGALWLSPFYLLFVPLSLFFFLRDAFLSATVCMVLLAFTIWQEYFLRKWLIGFLETKEPLK
jgi:hypothetical protein